MNEWIDDINNASDLAIAITIVALVAVVWFGFGVLVGFALWA